MNAPSIEYSQVSPMLIVLGVAVAGVLVEAFAPRKSRYLTQVALSLAGLVAAFVAVVLLARDLHGVGQSAVVGEVEGDKAEDRADGDLTDQLAAGRQAEAALLGDLGPVVQEAEEAHRGGQPDQQHA